MKYTLQKENRRLSSVDYQDTTRKLPLNFRKNDYMFFTNKKEAEERLNDINKRFGNSGLKVVEE